jgi:hypothetical protein
MAEIGVALLRDVLKSIRLVRSDKWMPCENAWVFRFKHDTDVVDVFVFEELGRVAVLRDERILAGGMLGEDQRRGLGGFTDFGGPAVLR